MHSVKVGAPASLLHALACIFADIVAFGLRAGDADGPRIGDGFGFLLFLALGIGQDVLHFCIRHATHIHRAPGQAAQDVKGMRLSASMATPYLPEKSQVSPSNILPNVTGVRPPRSLFWMMAFSPAGDRPAPG